MKRRILLSLLASAALAVGLACAGEPGPGLEIFNADDMPPVTSAPAPAPIAAPTAPSLAPSAPEPYYYPPVQTTGAPYVGQPYTLDANGQPEGDYQSTFTPAPSAPLVTDPYAPSIYSGPVVSEPYVPGDQEPTYSTPAYSGPDDFAAAPVADQVYETPDMVIAALNRGNAAYPGLDAAAVQGNLAQASQVILATLRERRVVNAALARGPGASLGTPMPHEIIFLNDMLIQANQNPGRPLEAVRRIDSILDSFNQPVLDDFNYNSMMEAIIMRLHADLTAIRLVLADPPEDVVYHEMARAYIRMATVCDFFVFPRTEFAADIDSIVASARTMFYLDGASVGGDVGGVSGTAFQDLLMLDRHYHKDRRFGSNVDKAWRMLDVPARHLLAMALPDQSLPKFGPRGERELNQLDIVKLKEIYPENKTIVERYGLAASASFPKRSRAQSYGGLFVSRSSNEGDARYLAVRFGPYGQLPGAPSHNDFGSLVVSSRSVNFIVDPGGYGGNAALGPSHSILTLDNQDTDPATYNFPGEPVDSEWVTNAAIDYASDSAFFADGKRWSRKIVYVKSLPGEGGADYWVLLDRVDMNGDNLPHQARIRFQMAPGINAYHDGSGILATPDFGLGSALRIFAIDSNSQLSVAEGEMGLIPSYVYDSAGGRYTAPSVVLDRTIAGDTTTTTILYPGENSSYRPQRIERDSDIIQGRTGAVVIDHGQDKIDVVAWAPPGMELVTPTLNLQLNGDVAVFRLRKGKIVRAAFVNLINFQAKEPDGGIWSMRVRGNPASLVLEPDSRGGWQVWSDYGNSGTVHLENVNLGPSIADHRMRVTPGQLGFFLY